ncbi:MAG: hypothetical protein LWX83_16100 [Anaerolineae bacterium]|nr:hypothetical protein [Anaerolineae bacterium]
MLIPTACSREDLLNLLFTATPTLTLTFTPSATLTPSPTASATATPTSSPTPQPSETPTATIAPSDTQPAESPTFGPSPTRTPSPSLTATETEIPSATPIPSITPTPTPHLAFLRLSKPGWMSKVVSPIRVEAVVSPGENGRVQINLIGEDGRIISTQELRYSLQSFQRYMLQQKVDFTIPGPAEYGRLEIRTRDRRGRDMSLTSVDLLLLSLGRDEIYAPVSLLEPYIIYYPEENDVIKGGLLLVNGAVQPVNQNPIIFDLVNETGRVLGSTRISAPQVEEGQTHAAFSAAVPYQVSGLTDARLIMRQESAGRISGNVAITSLLVKLQP